MEKWKIKAVQADLGIFTNIPTSSEIFRHTQTWSGIFRNYSGIFWTLCNPGLFRAVVYSEFWHIQNQKHIQNFGISKILAHSEPEKYSKSWVPENPRIFRTGGIYSEPCQTSTMERLEKQLTATIVFSSFNYFSHYQLFMSSSSWNKYDLFNAGLIYIPESFIQCKKIWGPESRGPGPWIFYIPPRHFTLILLTTFDFQHFLPEALRLTHA